jgi:branched-chain amino acid transport system substrate-binding protein
MRKIVALLLTVVAAFGLVACQEAEATVSRLVVTPPTKTEYIVDEAFNPAGLEVKAIFSDGTDKVLAASDYTVTGFTSATPGLVTLTVSYQGVTQTFGIAVFNPDAPEVALGLVLKSLPDQQIYNRDEVFNPAGLVVEVTYSTGRKAILTSADYTLTGFRQGIVGKYDVVVTFGELSASFYTEVRAVTVQGITATTIKVGNTATISGPFAFVGIPFAAGMRAAFEVVNEAGGIGGRMIEYINKDDGFDGTVGLTNTKQLIDEDKVFALVGHFGTPTVSATLTTIREAGIPMVYAATGVNVLYTERSPLDPVMPVQPIYLTDGRVMTARALREAVYGPNKDQKLGANDKVGVLYTTAADGTSIRDGIEIEARTQGVNANFIYAAFSATETAALTQTIQNFQSAGVKAIIVASNQAGFKAAIGTMQTTGVAVPTFTSYVNADVTAVDAATNYSFDIYTNAWVDIVSPAGQADVVKFVAAIQGASFLSEADKTAFAGNSFAIAGYIAAMNFIEGLRRVDASGKALTWESFIKAMESAPIDIPMGGTVDFSDGKRWGIDSMSLLKYNTTSKAFEQVRPIETLLEIRAK